MNYKDQNTTNYEYQAASQHSCNCPNCPQRPISPFSSNNSTDSALYAPTGTRRHPSINLDDVNISATPAQPWNTAGKRPDGIMTPLNGIPRNIASQAVKLDWLNREAVRLIKMPPVPQLSEAEILAYLAYNERLSAPQQSTLTSAPVSNATFASPDANSNYSYVNVQASYANPAVNAVNRCNMAPSNPSFPRYLPPQPINARPAGAFINPMGNLSHSNESLGPPAINTQSTYNPSPQSVVFNRQYFNPQFSRPTSNATYNDAIGSQSYSNASYGHPRVEARNLYNIAPPQTAASVQPIPSLMSPVPPPPSQQHPLLPGCQGQKRKRTTNMEDEIEEQANQNFDFNLLYPKKVANSKNTLGPRDTGMKNPHSDDAEKPESGTTAKGPSHSKSPKGKSVARNGAEDPESGGPSKSEAAKDNSNECKAADDEAGTSQDGGRTPKRARTSGNQPTESSSKTCASSSSDGGRLVEFARTVKMVVNERKFRHSKESKVPKDKFLSYSPASANSRVSK